MANGNFLGGLFGRRNQNPQQEQEIQEKQPMTELERIEQEISDMKKAESEQFEQGKKPWEFDLSAITTAFTKKREEQEAEEIRLTQENKNLSLSDQTITPKQETTKKYTTMIGGQLANDKMPASIKEPSDEVIEKSYPGGGIYRTTKGAIELSKTLDEPGRQTKRTLLSPSELYKRQKSEIDEYGKEFDYQEQMGRDFPQLAQYKGKYNFNKVRQVIDKNNLVNGKPTMYLEPVINTEELIRKAPKESEFVGDLNYKAKHNKALENYFQGTGLGNWKDLIESTGEIQNIYDVSYGTK